MGQKVRNGHLCFYLDSQHVFTLLEEYLYFPLQPQPTHRCGLCPQTSLAQGIKVTQVLLKGAFHYPSSSDWFSNPMGANEAFASVLREAPHFPLHVNLEEYSPELVDSHPATHKT